MFLKKNFYYLILFAFVAIILLVLKNNNKSLDNKIGGDFVLTNQSGQKITNDSFKGYYRLVFFGFTHCPDFCPNTLNNVGEIINEIDKKDILVPIFITVDPQRDTEMRLKKYLSNFHPKIIGLTGSKEQIGGVKKKYKIFSKKVMDEADSTHNHDNHDHGGYGVDHTTILYLMDKNGYYLSHFSPEDSSDDIIKRINNLL